jgi:hypothetical protein
VIAASIGAVLLPLPGFVGAAMFYSRGEQEAAWAVTVGSVVGVILYLFLFGVF